MRRRWLLVSGLAGLFVILVTAGDGRGQAMDRVTLQLKWVTQAQFAGYYAAKASGFYAAENLDERICGSPAGASRLAFTVQPTNTAAGGTITPPVEVTAYGAFGNLATGFAGNVTLTIGSNPGGGTLNGTTTVTAAAGVASFAALSINNAGVGYTLVAGSGGALTGATSGTFDIN